MDIPTLTQFFMWCVLLNGGLLLFWTLIWGFAPDAVYRTQHRWAPLSREQFGVFMYGFIGLFKILFLIFNFVPYLALLIIGG